MTRRAAVYVRISQDRNGLKAGVQRQHEDCLRLAASRGWAVAQVYEDNDISAATGRRRPAYQRLLRDLESGAVDAVAVWALDRLHRRPVELESFIDLADKRGVALANVAGDVDLGTSAGRLHARIMGAVARHEVEQKSERQTRAALQAAEQGRATGGPRPFGYAAGGLELEPAEAAEVEQMYEAVLVGQSLGAVARDLDARGVRTSLGKTWSATQVRAVLLRARNAGLRTHRGELVGASQWPAIVTEETWRAAVALLREPGRRTSPGLGRRYLLSGIALCGACGRKVTSAGTAYLGRDGKRSRIVYRCRSRQHVARQIAPVDAYVREIVVARLARPDAIELLVPDQRPDLAETRDEAQTLRVRLDVVAAEFADGELTASQLRVITERLRGRLAAAEARLAEVARSPLLGELVTAHDVGEVWDRLALDRQRGVVDSLMAVTILPELRPGPRRFNPDLIQVEWHG